MRRDEEAAADHYSVLGLPSGEEGSKLSQKVIRKAYYVKAMVLHPDKRPADSHSAAAAHRDFQKLLNSYEILKDERTRKRFDDECKAAKRRKVAVAASDLNSPFLIIYYGSSINAQILEQLISKFQRLFRE